MNTAFPRVPERVIKLKTRDYQTPQGCRVIATWYTSLQGELTEVVILEAARKQERRS